MFNRHLFCLVSLVSLAASVSGRAQKGDDAALDIPHGKIVGEWRLSYEKRLYAAFESIPYAKPPLGRHRFEEAEKAKKWRGVLTAKRLPNACVQFYDQVGQEDNSVIGDEDCLYLNVYSPNPVPNGNLPVIVFIHGGDFMLGSGVQFGPKFLMDVDVVLVTFNYRLGFLGFLSAEDPVLPGNLGLKDQQLVLKWVHDHIRHFGGNNKMVTLAGLSAGGVSVHYHMLSPRSKGLFHRAISMSGTAFCPWSLQEGAQQKAYALAASLGCPTDPTRDMVDCLKHRPVYQIVKATANYMPFIHAPIAPVAPVVEHKDTKDPFVVAHPYKLVKNGAIATTVPWLVSNVLHEGLYPCAIYLSKKQYIDEIDSRFEEIAPFLFDYNYTVPLNKHQDVAKKIKGQYFGKDCRVTEENFLKFVEPMSDRLYIRDVVKTVKLQASVQKEPVYYYFFQYKGEDSMGKRLSETGKDIGVCQGDDAGYVLDSTFMDPTTSMEDKKMTKIMTQMWYSFAYEGFPKVPSPDVKWNPITFNKDDDFEFLEINGPEHFQMSRNPVLGRDSFWSTLPFAENENDVLVHDEL